MPGSNSHSTGPHEHWQEARALAGRVAPRFLDYVWHRFQRDGCAGLAAGLSYTSLLSVVPLLAIGLAMFAAFPVFSSLRIDLIAILADNLAPDLATEATGYLNTYIRNAGEASGIGILGLVLSAILLINSIQLAFDRIWGGGHIVSRLRRLPVYWALITLGPILFGIALSISTYVFSMAGSADFYGLSTGLQVASFLLPIVLEIAGFALFYRLMPSRQGRFLDATAGAVLATVLFELLKKGFGLYLAYFPSYQVIYGALASVPIFLIWTYLVWVAVLIGAEVAAALPEWRSGRRSVNQPTSRGEILSYALGALARLQKAQISGGGESFDRLAVNLDADPGRFLDLLERLKRVHVVALGDDGHWVLIRDLDAMSLHALCRALGLTFGELPEVHGNLLAPVMARLAADEKKALSQNVGTILREIGGR